MHSCVQRAELALTESIFIEYIPWGGLAEGCRGAGMACSGKRKSESPFLWNGCVSSHRNCREENAISLM